MMAYLTQGLLGFDDAARLRLRDVYDWHQLVWRAFPGRDGAPRDFLTRLDRRERDGMFRLLLLAPREPTRPPQWPEEPEAWQTRPVTSAFLGYRRYRFQLRANPTKRENATRKRLPLRTSQELRAWLERKAVQGGFTVDAEALRILPEGQEWFQIEGRDHRGIHTAVEFEGLLAVTDQDRFKVAFTRGIGSAKAFGFGLLALVPIPDGDAVKRPPDGRETSH